MKDIPAHLECAYCERNYNVGGECRSNERLKGCLAFKLNPLGCIKNMQTCLGVPLYYDVPAIGIWNEEWTINGLATKFKINEYLGIKWNSKKGLLRLFVRISYFENEFAEDFLKKNVAPELKLIKGGVSD